MPHPFENIWKKPKLITDWLNHNLVGQIMHSPEDIPEKRIKKLQEPDESLDSSQPHPNRSVDSKDKNEANSEESEENEGVIPQEFD